MADQERIKNRLDNIRSVEPILGAMRTISRGSWQSAVSRQQRVRVYSQRLRAVLPALLPHLPAHPADQAAREGVKGGGGHKGASWRRMLSRFAYEPAGTGVTVVLVIGSERGLCGAFNSALARYAHGILARHRDSGTAVELAILGMRARRSVEREGHTVDWFAPLPMTTLPTSGLADSLIQSWVARYEAYELDAVQVVYHAYRNSTVHEPTTARLLPPAMPAAAAEPALWPPAYVDTDPAALYARLIRLWLTTEMYRILLDSAASEHSARFQLMEGATQNSDRLIDELTLALQSARQHAITSEMQELASGAGLVGSQS